MAHSNNIATWGRLLICRLLTVQSAVFLAGWQPAPRCSSLGTGHRHQLSGEISRTSPLTRTLTFAPLSGALSATMWKEVTLPSFQVQSTR